MLSDFLIGGISGVISRTITQPIELYRIQRQNSFVPNATIQDVIKKEGVRYLWKGNMVNCIRVFPYMSINYGVYSATGDALKEMIISNGNYQTNRQVKRYNFNWVYFVSGAFSGMVSTVIVYPLETVRSRLVLQTNRNKYNGAIDVLRKCSVRELYRGVGISMVGFSAYNSMNFYWVNYFKTIFNYGEDDHLMKLYGGGLSGLLSITVSYPSDLLRRRFQLQNFDKTVPKYDNLKDAMEKIYKGEGVRGFYRGILPMYMKIIPVSAIQFWCLDTGKKMMEIYK